MESAWCLFTVVAEDSGRCHAQQQKWKYQGVKGCCLRFDPPSLTCPFSTSCTEPTVALCTLAICPPPKEGLHYLLNSRNWSGNWQLLQRQSWSTFFHLSSMVWTSRMTSFVSSSAALWRTNCLKNCWSFRKAGGYSWEPPVYTLPLNALSACFQAEVCCQFPCPGKQLMLAWNKQPINHKQKAFPCLHWFLDFVCWIMNAIWAGFCNTAAFLLQYFSFSCPVKSVGPPSPVC